MNRIDRLFAILLVLQNRRTVRASEIAQRFEITERTVYRDIAALIEMGVPIVSLPGVGYQMMDGFYLPPLVFTPDEASALFLGAHMLTATGNFPEATQRAIEKLATALPRRTRQTAQGLAEIIQFFLPRNPFHLDAPHLVRLREAILQRRVIAIRYHSRLGDTVTEREVDPYGLTVSETAWYFHGYCHLRQDVRSFRLDRVESLSVLERSFDTPVSSLPPTIPELHTIRLKVNADAARWVRERQHYGYVGEEISSEIVVMTYHVELFSEIQAWILAWGAAVEVLEPSTLRLAIADEVAAMLDHYRPSETS
jgi:predicted DNA-binding transcriptional regulator YafY